MNLNITLTDDEVERIAAAVAQKLDDRKGQEQVATSQNAEFTQPAGSFTLAATTDTAPIVMTYDKPYRAFAGTTAPHAYVHCPVCKEIFFRTSSKQRCCKNADCLKLRKKLANDRYRKPKQSTPTPPAPGMIRADTKRYCPHCDQSFLPRHASQKLCGSTPCKKTRASQLNKEWYERKKQKGGLTKPTPTPVQSSLRRQCETCDEVFIATTPTQRYCGAHNGKYLSKTPNVFRSPAEQAMHDKAKQRVSELSERSDAPKYAPRPDDETAEVIARGTIPVMPELIRKLAAYDKAS